MKKEHMKNTKAELAKLTDRGGTICTTPYAGSENPGRREVSCPKKSDN